MPSEEAPLSFGDVILVPFPFTDQSAAKRRPAVVISSRDYNLVKPDLIIMAVTSQLRASASFGEVWLTGWTQAGLLKPSAIKPVIASLERSLVIRKLGTLTAADLAALRGAIAVIVSG